MICTTSGKGNNEVFASGNSRVRVEIAGTCSVILSEMVEERERKERAKVFGLELFTFPITRNQLDTFHKEEEKNKERDAS